MRQVKQPIFTDRETRSSRHKVQESEASSKSEAPPANVGPVDHKNHGTKRKGKGKATEPLGKKPRLADNYLDPFADVLVPQPSLTPAQSDALSLSLHSNDLPQSCSGDLPIDPQLSRMGQAVLSASTDTKHLQKESLDRGLTSQSDGTCDDKIDLRNSYSQPPDSPLSSEAPLRTSPSPFGSTGPSEPARTRAPTPRREFLLPALPISSSSRASSVAPDWSSTTNRNSKAMHPKISYTKLPHGAVTPSRSITSSHPFSRSPTMPPANSLHLRQSGYNDTPKTTQMSMVKSTKKFTFLALPSKDSVPQNTTPTPRHTLPVNKKLATKPITPTLPNLSLSDSSMPFHSEGSSPIADMEPLKQIPMGSSLLTAHRHPIPTLVSDTLAFLENAVANLQRDLNASSLKISGFIQDHETLRKENLSLKAKLHAIEDRTATLENDTAQIEQSVSAYTQTLSKLDDMFEDVSSRDTRSLGSKNGIKKALKPVRDNVFNTAVRKVLLRAMHTDAKNVKFLKPFDGDKFFMPDPETDDGVILRPNFEISWLDNALWHDDVVKFIRRKAHYFTLAFTEKMMEAKTDADILERIGSNFKGWAAAYSKEKRRVEGGGAGDPTNRRKGRKIRKFHQREAVRDVVQMQGSEWDFFFQPAYQSTDETDSENNMDPDSEEENVDIKVKEKAWLSRAPCYRSELFQSAVDAIEVAVARHQASQVKDGKTAPHRRRRGSPKEHNLPIPGKKKAKISLACIDPQWIEDHPDELRPTRIDMDKDQHDIQMAEEDEHETDTFSVKGGSVESDSDEQLYD